jgi:ATP-binding cassette subfamily B (MDR/TAP) protein 1
MSVIVASASLTAIAPYLIDFGRAASAAAELFQLMDRPSNIDPFDQSGEKPAEVQGGLDFEHITFSYPMRPGIKVLDDFSLHIPAGKVTALVGASGSGKSTIVGLIERWYNPGSGTVKLDGRPIDKLNLEWLRQQVRLVQQEPVLFSGTVFDNIASGLAGTLWQDESQAAKLARVQEAAKVAFAHDFIEALPDGYHTVIGERGGLLSGGQKQRVAIARSVVSQPRILLLDEATSALDPQAEELVQQALDNVSKGRTTIAIAHKLATIRAADNIVVMEKGRIVEQGTHQSLLEAGGTYAQLVKAQDLSVAAKQSPASDSSDAGTGDEREEQKPLELARSLTRYSTTTKGRMETQLGRDDFDSWKRIGLVHTIWRIVRSTPELCTTYLLLFLGCMGAGKTVLLEETLHKLTALQLLRTLAKRS